MRQLLIGLSVSIAFILGCVAAPSLVPKATAEQRAAGLQKWEYFCDRPSSDMTSYIPKMNSFGAQGWEAMEIEGLFVCYKRPLP